MLVAFDIDGDKLDGHCLTIPILALMFEGCLYERVEQGVRREWPRAKFGMKLRAEHERVHIARQLCDFHETAVGRAAGEDEPRIFELLNVFGVYFVSMAVTLGNRIGAVAFGRNRP